MDLVYANCICTHRLPPAGDYAPDQIQEIAASLEQEFRTSNEEQISSFVRYEGEGCIFRVLKNSLSKATICRHFIAFSIYLAVRLPNLLCSISSCRSSGPNIGSHPGCISCQCRKECSCYSRIDRHIREHISCCFGLVRPVHGTSSSNSYIGSCYQKLFYTCFGSSSHNGAKLRSPQASRKE